MLHLFVPPTVETIESTLDAIATANTVLLTFLCWVLRVLSAGVYIWFAVCYSRLAADVAELSQANEKGAASQTRKAQKFSYGRSVHTCRSGSAAASTAASCSPFRF